MKAEDTVMLDTKMIDLGREVSRAEADHAIAKAQAEITWKAAFKYALKGVVIDGGYESVKKAGIKEVVERGNRLLDRYSQSNVTSFWMEVVSQTLTDGG